MARTTHAASAPQRSFRSDALNESILARSGIEHKKSLDERAEKKDSAGGGKKRDERAGEGAGGQMRFKVDWKVVSRLLARTQVPNKPERSCSLYPREAGEDSSRREEESTSQPKRDCSKTRAAVEGFPTSAAK